MKTKKQPGKKVLDISKPKKRTSAADAPTAPQLVIPKRSIIVADADDSKDPTVEDTEPVKAKQTVGSIQPPTPPAPKPEQTQSTPQQTDVPSESETPQPAEAASDTPEEPAQPQEPSTQEPEEPEDAGSKSSKESPHVRKALEDAKREQEIQGYIHNREFFVPINSVARKRSLKVSTTLIVVELLLGLVLLNLMLDAGLIYLIEKIPHTNFFELR